MRSNVFEIEKDYQTKEISELLGIESVTVRKYCHALEQYGYEFEKNGDRRVFKHSDLAVLQQLKYMKDKTGMTLNATAEIVVMKNSDLKRDQASTDITLQTQEYQENQELMRYDEEYVKRSITLLLKQNEEILSLLDQERKEKENIQKELVNLREELNQQRKQTFDRLDTINDRMEAIQKKAEKQSVWKKVFGKN